MISIRPMTAADIADGMRLKTQAGWNQVEADWRRFLALGPEGAFVALSDGRIVGSVTTCCFDAVGWIAMLLVEPARRGAGIGRRLLVRALEYLDAQGVRSVRLDATAAGRPLYESLGFNVDFPLGRYGGIASEAGPGGEIREGHPGDLPLLAALDRDATGTERRALLDRLVQDNPVEYVVAGPPGGPIRGFALWRPGSSAHQIGPCIAERDAGRPLLDEAARRLAGRLIIIDIPVHHGDAVAWATGIGLTATREFWRMTRGEPAVEDTERLWAGSGPEMG
jgi:predicted N-acetyltransferase YhbS